MLRWGLSCVESESEKNDRKLPEERGGKGVLRDRGRIEIRTWKGREESSSSFPMESSKVTCRPWQSL